MLGIFSPYEYTWTTTGQGAIMLGTFVAVFLSFSGLVYFYYPDRPAYPREFEGGLERELGGPGAVRVGFLSFSDDSIDVADRFSNRHECRATLIPEVDLEGLFCVHKLW